MVFAAGMVLLVRRKNEPSYGRWGLPGGVVELGETVEEAVIREVKEETCIRANPLRLITTFDSIIRDEENRIHFHYVLCNFLCEYVGGELKASNDASEAVWARLNELKQMDVPSRTRRLIEKVAYEEGFLYRIS